METVHMVMFVWWEAPISMRVEWSCASMTSGGQCVMTPGTALMLLLSASSWDMHTLEVSWIWVLPVWNWPNLSTNVNKYDQCEMNEEKHFAGCCPLSIFYQTAILYKSKLEFPKWTIFTCLSSWRSTAQCLLWSGNWTDSAGWCTVYW